MNTISQIVEDGAAQLGIDLTSTASAKFEKYFELLKKEGSNTNLTAIKTPEDVARLHFLDSITLLKAADLKSTRLIDIGSGAGFPGVALKIAEPTIDLTLIDSAGKRIRFLTQLCAALEIDAACINARAEELSHETEMREKFDIATSRAVAQLSIISELCLPFVRVGGLFLPMKGPEYKREAQEALEAIETLGAHIEGTKDYTIPGTSITHTVLTIRKTQPTPKEYPRRFAKIKKAPL